MLAGQWYTKMWYKKLPQPKNSTHLYSNDLLSIRSLYQVFSKSLTLLGLIIRLELSPFYTEEMVPVALV